MEFWFRLCYVFLGCLGAALFTQNSPSAIVKLKRLFPTWSDQAYERVDFCLVVVFGTALAFYYDPPDPGKAMIAGFGAVALFKQVLQGTKRRQP